MNDPEEPDDSSQEARTSEVRRLVDDVLDKLHFDPEASLENESAEDSDAETGLKPGEPGTGEDEDDARKESRIAKRKSTRSTRWRTGHKGRSRRAIFKKHVYKSPASCAVPVTSDFVFHRGLYYQVGDIVSIIDAEDGQTYYAQIRGFLTDEYCERSAALTWLIPTKEAPAGSFDAAFYMPGPEEDLPRPLDAMQFEQHAPSDYFRDSTAMAGPSPSRTRGYIWTCLSPRIVRRNL